MHGRTFQTGAPRGLHAHFGDLDLGDLSARYGGRGYRAGWRGGRETPLKRGGGGEGVSPGGGGGEGGGGAAAQADAKAYLCSGCDAYVTLEPCAMCAMALAHARIRRLVYAVPCASEGALGSRYRVHTERSINHHYQVFRGLLCDEARAALDVDESRAA